MAPGRAPSTSFDLWPPITGLYGRAPGIASRSGETIELANEIRPIQRPLQQLQCMPNDAEVEPPPASSDHRRDVLEVVRTPGEDLHRDDVLRRCDRDHRVPDLPRRGPLE